MTKEQKLKAIGEAYTTQKRGADDIYVLNDKLDEETKNVVLNIQRNLDVTFDQSYEIMGEACSILADKNIAYLEGDKCDLYADADSQANVYTGVQLSYLNINNEAEISELMNDEAITSIAQACSAWFTRKVVEACEQLKDYILA